MFEIILEKILLNYFGKYIEGIDSNNLHLGIIIIIRCMAR